MKVNILGTEYTIETHKLSEDEFMVKNKFVGYCREVEKKIVIADTSEEKYFEGMDEKSQKKYWKTVCRHEIIHAFLNESGLSDSSNCYDGAWAKNEEMVDWFAVQSPKIFKVFAELDIVDMESILKARTMKMLAEEIVIPPDAIIPPLSTGVFNDRNKGTN